MDDSLEEGSSKYVIYPWYSLARGINTQIDYLNLTFRSPSFVLIGPSLIPSALYVFLPGAKRSVFVINTLALSFAHNALSTIKLDTFWTGLILLSGLFLYDIWWVFGTEVVSIRITHFTLFTQN